MWNRLVCGIIPLHTAVQLPEWLSLIDLPRFLKLKWPQKSSLGLERPRKKTRKDSAVAFSRDFIYWTTLCCTDVHWSTKCRLPARTYENVVVVERRPHRKHIGLLHAILSGNCKDGPYLVTSPLCRGLKIYIFDNFPKDLPETNSKIVQKRSSSWAPPALKAHWACYVQFCPEIAKMAVHTV